jgi:hypothetical protein
MRTVCGWARRVEAVVRRGRPAVVPVAAARAAGPGRPLLSNELGEQTRAGWLLDQVDPTTCGSAVLLALAAWADPDELSRLDGEPGVRQIAGGRVIGFGARYDARQQQVHRQTNRFWPRALGTTPWAMVAWLRRHVPGAGRYRVRMVDDVCAPDVDAVIASVDVAVAAGRPVPLLVGALVPRHYVLVLGRADGGWRVYEPTSGSVRTLDSAMIGARRLRSVLGFDRLHAALLPC